jgi:hypothetical protein
MTAGNLIARPLLRVALLGCLIVAGAALAAGAIAYRESDRLLRPPDQPVFAAERADPMRTLGIGYRNVRVADPLGDMPAWLVPGRRRTWVITVHGMWAPRA